MKLTRGLCSLVFLLVLAEVIDSWTKHYCTERRSVIRYKNTRDIARCGSRRVCCYYKRVAYRYYYNVKVCCPGWGSCYCHIPICNPACASGKGKCVSPDTCRCYSPTITGLTCNKYRCSYLTDCYPGVCVPHPRGSKEPVCACHSGFTGTNCNTLEVGPSIDTCSATFRNIYEGSERNVIKVDCNMNDITTSDYATTVYVNDRDLTRIDISWSASYQEPANIPDIPANVVLEYGSGVVASLTKVTLQKGDGKTQKRSSYPCDKDLRATVPKSQVSCVSKHEIDPRTEAVDDEYRYIVSFGATSGGYKRINIRGDQLFSTVSFTKEIHVIFDVEKPYHCLQYDDCDDDYTDLATPVAFGLSEDISKTNVTFIIFGWNDTLSGIDHFEYEAMIMAPDDSGDLSENSMALSTQTWRYGEGKYGIPIYTPDRPGMYSIVLSVVDNATNVAKARTLLLYDPVSTVTVNPEAKLYVSNASPESDYTWITDYVTGGSLDVIMNWTDYFENKFHHDNGLLRAVVPVPADSDIIDDMEGDRTLDEIPNARGIIGFKIAYMKDTLLNNLNNKPADLTMPQLQQVYTASFTTVNDGETIKFWITATDVLNNVLTSTYMVHLDNSRPFIDTPTKRINVYNESDTTPFASRITLPAWDYHSGIGNIYYTLRDQTAGGEEVYKSHISGGKAPFTNNDLCRQSAQCSYCIPMGECFDSNNLIYIDHCRILLRQGHTFSVDFEVTNQAKTNSSTVYQVGQLNNLIGINKYPPVENIVITDITATSFLISWTFSPACYARLAVRLKYEESNIIHKKQIEKDRNSFTVENLPSNTNISVKITVVYQTDAGEKVGEPVEVNGTTAASNATTDRPNGGETGGLSGGAIAGIVIGVLLLLIILILILVLCLVFVCRRRGKPFSSMPFVAFFTKDQKKNLRSNVNLEKNVTTAAKNNAYVASHKEVNKLSNPTYFAGGETDEIYTYDNVEMTGTYINIVNPRNVAYGDTICDGKFANIVLANVKKKKVPTATLR